MPSLKSVKAADAEIVRVTPTIAGEWLAENKKNRNIAQNTVDLYARDMTAGQWHFTGEPIKFDKDGHLIDGQHRLMAVLRSGKPISFLVVRGLSSDAQDLMDSGKKRSAADMLQLHGHANATLTASTARFGLIIDSGIRVAGQSVSKPEISAYIDANPDLIDAVSHANSASKYLPFSPTALAYSWMLLNRVDSTDAAVFFDSLANNATKGKGDPRNTLLRRMNSAKRADERLRPDDQVQFIVRAWNAYRKGADLHILKVRADGGNGSVRVTIPKAV